MANFSNELNLFLFTVFSVFNYIYRSKDVHDYALEIFMDLGKRLKNKRLSEHYESLDSYCDTDR